MIASTVSVDDGFSATAAQNHPKLAFRNHIEECGFFTLHQIDVTHQQPPYTLYVPFATEPQLGITLLTFQSSV